ncbi:hypothetical protein PGTUg99_000362 [Puccinia graminis f. sp. tritici]|uniref:Uncharacterized protein n=1 Tax=Puccinia graminis f. sp. tritici TaxID=56615 RepID=A0A5B0RTJ5_PUCGR|nr:hypothetical protein PGTUg99_000362 [Puccinia graminis f. sp. tritici]
MGSEQAAYTTDVRPALARNLTAVRIVNDHPAPNELMGRDEPRLGSSTSPVGRDTEGITLADLPRAMEAEQFREQQKPLPTQVATLSELSALESVIVKHVAALTLLVRAQLSRTIPHWTNCWKLSRLGRVTSGANCSRW